MAGPLAGRRVLVTRAKGQASALVQALQAAGAETIEVPVIAIVPPRDGYASLDHAIGHLNHFDWVIFTSANAVRIFCERALYAGVHPAAQAGKVAVVGPATAEAVRDAGMKIALQPKRFVAEALLEALRPLMPGESVLLVRAEVARDVLPQGLREAGVEVTIADAYRNELPGDSAGLIREVFTSEVVQPQAIMFTSSSTARNIRTLLDAAGIKLGAGTVLASIGPITTATMRELGMEPTVEAKESTIPGLVQAVEAAFSS